MIRTPPPRDPRLQPLLALRTLMPLPEDRRTERALIAAMDKETKR